MALPPRRSIRSLAQVEEFITQHPGEENLRLRVHNTITSLGESKQMAVLLREKMDSMSWSVIDLYKLEHGVVPVYEEVEQADRKVARLLRITNPSVPRRLPPGYGPLRISGINHQKVGNGNAASAPPSRHPSKRRGGRRHKTPPVVHPYLAQDLVVAGNNLVENALDAVVHLGKTIAAVGLDLLRKDKDRATLHADLLRARAEIQQVWAGEVVMNLLID